MPVELSTIDAENRPIDDKILDVLQRAPELAYTDQELFAETFALGKEDMRAMAALALALADQRDQDRVLAPIREALARLETSQRVGSRMFREKKHFFFRKT